MRVDLSFFRNFIQRHGVAATAFHVAYRAANRVTPVAIWNAMRLTEETIDRSFLADPKAAQMKLMDAEAMRPWVGPQYSLTDRFINDAAQRGDRCFASFDGETLTSYGWYATRPVALCEVDAHLMLHYDPAYAYMHNGFTHPEYRGQRLHAIGMAVALQAYVGEGFKGLVSYVDSSNFASLKSCHRMGYETFGRVVMFKFGERYVCKSTPGCREYAFEVQPSPAWNPQPIPIGSTIF